MYACDCEDCKIQLSANSKKTQFQSVFNTVEKALKRLYDKGSYQPSELLNVPEYKAIIEETVKVFDEVIKDNAVPEEMSQKLKNDAFIFSGLKTHAQLMEATTMLLDDKGKVRNFEQFARDFNKINKNYNQNYLEAEWQFAISSSQSAANWAKIDKTGRYNLQYRTANDDRVRDNHRVLHDITLPQDDPFWLSYYPPNGWRCRCRAVEVLKSKYEVSDSQKAQELGEKATTQIDKNGKNKLEIFRFNPGAEQKLFPPKHPYNKVKGAEEVKKAINKTIIPKGLLEVEEKFGVKVPRELLNHLEIDNFVITNNNNERTYYTNIGVKKLNVQDWTFKNGYQKNNILVHELGHAIDYQKGLAERPEVKSLMDKYRDKYSANRNKLYKYLDGATKATVKNKTGNEEWIDQASDYLDILMALNPKYGAGHSKEYYSGKLKPEREFIAHCFQLKYNGTGNRFIKRVDSDLHDDMIKLLDEILK